MATNHEVGSSNLSERATYISAKSTQLGAFMFACLLFGSLMGILDIISILIAATALCISLLTLWLTLLRKGEIRMTQPTTIFFGPDSQSSKIYLRTLLYSTSKKGQVIENMYARIRRGETQQNFNIWVYGNEKLYRGSGLFVGESGVTVNHHFLLPPDVTEFDFKAGEYVLAVFAKLVGHKKHKQLTETRLYITETEAEKIRQQNTGIYFDWGPDAEKYHSHIDIKPKLANQEAILSILQSLEQKDPPVSENVPHPYE